jgi:stearoyl-CoA desaturase (delta-9 desaturase)
MKKICWNRVVFLLGYPIIALTCTVYYLATQPFNLGIWILFALFYMATQMSITAGYHRLFSHRAYQASSWLKWLYALFGAAALQNSILIWCRDHRVHHRFVDTDLDPYNINRGFWYAHLGWMMLTEEKQVDVNAYGRDLENDPIVMFQDKYYLPLALAMTIALPVLLGWAVGSAFGGFAIVVGLRLFLAHHFTFFINSWCHIWGRQPYSHGHTAKDSFLMAVATFGEGYHNFHHSFANDYRNGVKWYQWDPTKWSIRLFSFIGGAWNLNRTPQIKILQTQMAMDELRVKSSWPSVWENSFQDQLDNMRQKIHAASAKVDQLKAEYQAEYKLMRERYAQSSREKMEDMKTQLRLARADFRAARRQWRQYNAWLLRAARIHFTISMPS